MQVVKSSEPAPQESKLLKTGNQEVFDAITAPKIKSGIPDEALEGSLRYCMSLVGIRGANLPVPLEKQVIIEFIKKSFGSLSPLEIKLAFDLAINERLDLSADDIKHYENFSCAYISRILKAYCRWVNQNEKFQSNVKRPETDQKQIEPTGEVDWSPEWEKLLESARNGYFDPLYCRPAIYDWLKRHDRILLNDRERNEIIEECRQAYAYELMVALRTANAPVMRAKYELLIKDGREWRENDDLFNHVIMISKQETLKRQAYLTVKNEYNELPGR